MIPSLDDATVSESLTCHSCDHAFASVATFRSDWHRHNDRRCLWGHQGVTEAPVRRPSRPRFCRVAPQLGACASKTSTERIVLVRPVNCVITNDTHVAQSWRSKLVDSEVAYEASALISLVSLIRYYPLLQVMYSPQLSRGDDTRENSDAHLPRSPTAP